MLWFALQLGLNVSPPGVRRLEDALEEYTHSELIPDYKVGTVVLTHCSLHCCQRPTHRLNWRLDIGRAQRYCQPARLPARASLAERGSLCSTLQCTYSPQMTRWHAASGGQQGVQAVELLEAGSAPRNQALLPTLKQQLQKPDAQVKDGMPPVEASKAVKLSKLPPLLVVHMQRFAYDATGTSLCAAASHFREYSNTFAMCACWWSTCSTLPTTPQARRPCAPCMMHQPSAYAHHALNLELVQGPFPQHASCRYTRHYVSVGNKLY